MTTIIRLATLDDAVAIAKIHTESWRIAYKGIISDNVLDNIDINHRIESWGNSIASHNVGSLLFVSDEDSAITGFAGGGVGRDDDYREEAELYCIYLAGSAMGKGTGRALYTVIAEFARASGFSTMYNWCLEKNLKGHEFYMRMGAKRIDGIERDSIMDKEIHRSLLFRKDLSL